MNKNKHGLYITIIVLLVIIFIATLIISYRTPSDSKIETQNTLVESLYSSTNSDEETAAILKRVISEKKTLTTEERTAIESKVLGPNIQKYNLTGQERMDLLKILNSN